MIQLQCDSYDELKSKYDILRDEHTQIYAGISDLLATGTPSHVEEKLTTLTRSMEMNAERIQQFEQRSRSVEAMVGRMTEETTKLALAYAGPDLQGVL